MGNLQIEMKAKCLTFILLSFLSVAMADYPNNLRITVHNNSSGALQSGGTTWAANGQLIGNWYLPPWSTVIMNVDPHVAPEPNNIWCGYNNGTWVYQVIPWDRDSGPYSIDIYFGAAPCTTNLTATVTNVSPSFVYEYYWAEQNTIPVDLNRGTSIFLHPGESGTITSGQIDCLLVQHYAIVTKIGDAVPCTTNMSASILNESVDLTKFAYWTNSTDHTAGSMISVDPSTTGVAYTGEIQCTNVSKWSLFTWETNGCFRTLTWHALNNSDFWRIYAVRRLNLEYENQRLVAPGAYYDYQKIILCSKASDYELYMSQGGGDDVVQPTGDHGITNGIPGDSGTNSVGGGNNPPVTNSAPPTVQPPDSSLPLVTNVDKAILWSNTNNDVGAVTSAAKDSGQALFNAANQAAAQNHSDLSGVNNSIKAANAQAHSDATNANNAQNAISKQAHQDSQTEQGLASAAAAAAHSDSQGVEKAVKEGFGGLTNYALETTQKSVDQSLFAIKGTVAGISNLMSGLFADYGTNAISDSTNALEVAGFDTNAANDLHTNFSLEVAGETNSILAELASRTASPELALVESDFATFIEGFKLDDMDDGWPAPPMTYTFQWFGGSKTIDFNPMNYHLDGSAQISEIFSAAKALWSWLLAIIYLARCASDAGKAIEMCEMARGVTVTSPTTKKTYT